MQLKDNPFYLLQVSITDSKESVIAAAEDRAFEDPDNEDVYEKAKNTLLNSKHRLSAEIHWIPGLNKQQEKSVLNSLIKKEFYSSELPNPLAQLNLECFQLCYQKEINLPEAIYRIDRLYAKLNPDMILEWIEETRKSAHYPAIQNRESIANEMHSLQDSICSSIHDIVKSLPRERYTDIANKIADYLVKSHGVIVEEFISSYELDVNAYLHQTEELITSIRENIKNNPKMVTVDALEQQVTPWVQACRPMVLLSKSRGLFFPPVGSMFREIRNLAIDIHNEKSLSEISLRIIQIIKDKFSFMLEGDIETKKTLDEDIKFLQETVKSGKANQGFIDAKNAFVDMRETMKEKLFFELGHEAQIMSFYRNYFRRNYVPTIRHFLQRDDIPLEGKKTLYAYAAVIFCDMGKSLTWANEFGLAHQVGVEALQYAKQGNIPDIIEEANKLVNETKGAERTTSTSSTTTSTTTSTPSGNTNSDNGGCFIYLICVLIGGAILGPIGMAIGFYIAAKISKE